MGKLIIIISAIIAAVSMLFNWADVPGAFDKTGMALNLYFVLILWLYPTIRTLRNQPINSIIASLTSFAGFAFSIIIYNAIESKKFVGAGFGWSLFMTAVVILSIGLLIYIITVNIKIRRSRDAEAPALANTANDSPNNTHKKSANRFSPFSFFRKIFENENVQTPPVDTPIEPVEAEGSQDGFDRIEKVLFEQSASIDSLHIRHKELAVDCEKLAAGFAKLAIEQKYQRSYANKLTILTGLILTLSLVTFVLSVGNATWLSTP